MKGALMLENWINKFDFLQKIFKKEKEEEQSGKIAKERLKLVLIHDKSTINPQLFNLLRVDILKVISKYMVVNEQQIEMGIDNKNGTTVLAASIPIVRIKSPKISDLAGEESLEETRDYEEEIKDQDIIQASKAHRRLRRTVKSTALRYGTSSSQILYRRRKKRKVR